MAKKKWYAWHDDTGEGGIYETWDECEAASSRKPGEKHKGFRTYEEAWAFAYPDKPLSKSDTVIEASSSQTLSISDETHLLDQMIAPDNIPLVAEESTTDDDLPWDEEPKLDDRPPWDEESKLNDRLLWDEDKNDSSQVHPISSIQVSADQFWEKFHFSRLSKDQRRAVQAVDGNNLLFAVPGSGKTTVLMARAGYMVHVCGIPAGKMMTMTFTRSAAQEMRDRYHKYFPCDQDKNIPDFRTIHSFCMDIALPKLRKAGFNYPCHVVDEHLNEDAIEKDRKLIKEREKINKFASHTILSTVLKYFNIPDADANDENVHETVQTAFSGIKNRELKQEKYDQHSIRIKKNAYPMGRLFAKYQQELQQRDCMDYDDMLIYTLKGLIEIPQVLHELQETYRYWSIDEAQDNSLIQNKLLKLLSGESGNLFMVGDDDQSIFSFRGAESRLLLDFGEEPGVQKLIMGTNYRSDINIVKTSKLFIEQNHSREDKQMNASHTEEGTIRIPQSFRTEAGQ